MRTIDADAFDKFLENAEAEAHRIQKYVFASALNTIRGNLREFPTAESMVHCPDCEYWDERLIRCNKHKDSMMYGVHDFCSKGKRKGENNEVN